MRASWIRIFSCTALLTGCGEIEALPLGPGPVRCAGLPAGMYEVRFDAPLANPDSTISALQSRHPFELNLFVPSGPLMVATMPLQTAINLSKEPVVHSMSRNCPGSVD